MAYAKAAVNGDIFSVLCIRCSLQPACISVWDEASRVQVYMMPITSMRLEEVITWTRSTRRTCQIWEGDVLVACWDPDKEYVTYFKGRCGE